jgi:hypothetical protein
MKIKLDAIYGNKQMDDMMHFAGVFEPFKKLATHNVIELTAKEALGFKQKQVVIEKVKEALEASGMTVVFISIRTANNVKNTRVPAFIAPGISLLSDGKRCAMFRDVLFKAGYEVATDEHMRVVSARLKSVA